MVLIFVFICGRMKRYGDDVINIRTIRASVTCPLRLERALIWLACGLRVTATQGALPRIRLAIPL